MRSVVVCVAASLLCGCASFENSTNRNIQIGLTGLMAVDTAQTVQIAKNPDCLYEANPIAAKLFGSEHPSPERVIGTNIIVIAAHWMLGGFLDRKANAPINLDVDALEDIKSRNRWKAAQRTYQIATFVGHGGAVANNFNHGISPTGFRGCR